MASSNDTALSYGLCVCTASAVMLNLALLIWHNLRFKTSKDGRYLKHAFSFTTAVYMLLGIAIIILTLYDDEKSLNLCKFGGFLTLFAAQECFWIIATSCVILLLWIRTADCHGYEDSSFSSGGFVSHKWSMPIFVLVIIVKCIVLAILSFLPVTNVDYFDNEMEQNVYLCVPLQVPRQAGWGYSALVVVLNWIALIVTIAACVACLIHVQTLNPCDLDTPFKQATTKHKRAMVLKWIMLISYGFNTVLWTLALTILSITYFSGGDALNINNTRWGVGYMTSLIILIHPVMVFFLECMSRKKVILQNYCGDVLQTSGCPRQLESMQKLAVTWQKKDVHQYLIHWKGKSGSLISGVMKVFHPSANSKYQNEVKMMAKVVNIPPHPNVMKYHWYCSQNPFAATIADLTGDVLSVESGLICKNYYPDGSLHQFLKSRVHQLNDVGIHKLTQDIASGLEFIHDLSIVHNGLNTQCIYMASVSEKIGLSAVIGDFENSYEVPFNLQDLAKQNLYTISASDNLKKGSDSSKFSADIRAFGIIVLEMLVSLSEHNYKKASRNKQSKSRTSSVCSSDTHSSFTLIPQGCAASLPKPFRTQEKPNLDKMLVEERSKNSQLPLKISEQSEDTAKLKRTPSIETYLDPVENSVNYENLKDIQRIQQRSLPPIPIEKVVEEVQSCASSSIMQESAVDKPVIHFDQSSAFTPKQPRASLGKQGLDIRDCVKAGGVTREQRADSFLSPKSPIPPTKPSVSKPEVAPKPNLLKSIQQVKGLLVLTESGESDTDTLKNLPSPTSSTSGSEERSPENSLKTIKQANITTVDVEHEDVYNQSVTSMGSFDTIYEDEECLGENSTRSLDSGLGKSQNFERQHVVKRKSSATVKHEIGDVSWKRKRISTGSFTNESVVSGDSGMGSSQYTASQYGTHSEGSVAGWSSLNAPGSRDPIYEGDSSSYVSDPECYSLLAPYLERAGPKLKIDSGIESAFESCDENPQKASQVASSRVIKQLYQSQGKTVPVEVIRKDNETAVDMDCDDSEVLPDLVIRKKPCRGQHKHLKGMTCCSHSWQPSKPNKAPPKPPRTSQVKTMAVKKDTTDSDIVLVDEGTMTTGSLERKKVASESIQTDTESYISGLSAATVKSDSCRCVGKHLDCDIQSFHSAGHIHSRGQLAQKYTRQPKLGITAVNFSRISNNSARSTPLVHSRTQSGSTQSLANGRSSVTSGRQSTHSLGHNSINNSVLSLLQDSNLFSSKIDTIHEKNRKLQSPRSAEGGKVPRRRKTASSMVTHHPVVQHILQTPESQDVVLDALQNKGFLGYTSAQLVPLLKDCWLKEDVVSSNEILKRLNQVLPSASM